MSTEVLPGTPELTVERNVPCPLTDGVTSYVDVYRPVSADPLPALVISTPYDKEVAESNVGFAHPAWYARHGYIVVAHDTRGRFKSEGTFNPFFHERTDLARVVEWAAELEDCDGQVATYGFSYPGLNQLLAAQENPGPLQAIAPSFTAGSPYREWFFSQGAFALAFAASWANYLALDTAAQRGDDTTLAQLGAALADAQKWYWALPVNAYPPLANGQAPYFFDWVEHPTFDDFWNEIEVDHTRIEQPGLHVGGWYDVFIRGTVRNFSELTRVGHAPQKLVIGPW
ncbi:MAG: CocE/NonD family hydrolase, partial [Gaiellaceae bacterium]